MKKTISVLCTVCIILCMLPIIAASASGNKLNHAVNLFFNDTDWTGNTQYINELNRFHVPYGGGPYSLKTANAYDLGDSFSVTTYLHPINHYTNYYGEYCSITVGSVELREYNYNSGEKNSNGAPIPDYQIKLYINNREVAARDYGTESPNHFYSIVKVDGKIRIKIDSEYITLTDASSKEEVDSFSAAGLDFSSAEIKVRLATNSSGNRYAEGCIIEPNYTDSAIVNEDKLYPESGVIVNNENEVYGYLGNAITIPQGRENGIASYNNDGIYFESDIWQAVPMISKKQIEEYGFVEGGESCQQTSNIACSTDGELVFIGTDCGGQWRSLDGGDHWSIASIGMTSAGASGYAIDPINKNHVIVVGNNTCLARSNGLFVTFNATQQCEWQRVLTPTEISGGADAAIRYSADPRVQIVYDAASYNSELGYCTTAYWSVEDITVEWDMNGDKINEKYDQSAMWKTTDGGLTWKKLEDAVGTIYVDGAAQDNSKFLAYAELDSVTSNGTTYIYAATDEGYDVRSGAKDAVAHADSGFYVSTDGGKNWAKTSGLIFRSIDTVDNNVSQHAEGKDGYIWASTDTAMYKSTDFGKSFNKVHSLGYPQPSGNGKADNIIVSSLNPDNIYLTWRAINGNGYYSHDGGITWYASTQYKDEAWQPICNPSYYGYWSNKYENTLYIVGGGIFKSIDAGENLHWNSSGYNNILISGRWNFNVNNPNLISVSSQDFNGGFSTDAGKTWAYLKWKGISWGGYTYGSYMLNEQHIIACDADSWTGTRHLWITHDGGETFADTGIIVEGTETAIGCIGKDNIAFMGEWRTDDYGYSWTRMDRSSALQSSGCDGVYTVDKQTGVLFGKKGTMAVYSADDGLTWHQLGNLDNEPSDMAYDHQAGILYVTAYGALRSCHVDFSRYDNKFEIIEFGGERAVSDANSCAVDPNNPNVVYVSTTANINYPTLENCHVYRSLDRGKTWTVLTRIKGDGRDNCPDGGKSAGNIRVSPTTGELFASTGCKGMWKIAAPAQWYLDDNKLSQTNLTPNADYISTPDGFTADEIKNIPYAESYTNRSYDSQYIKLEYIGGDTLEWGKDYLKVPDGVTIYVGDRIQLGANAWGTLTRPDGTKTSSIFMNTTYIKGKNYYQACSNHHTGNPIYYVFDEPGEYTLFTSNGNGAESGLPLITFTVVDKNAGEYTYVSTEDELRAIANDLNGTYIITGDINVSGDWTPIGTADTPFNGLIFGNGYTVSGLNNTFIDVNNGSVSHLTVEGNVAADNSGLVANRNDSYIGHVMCNGSVSGNRAGGIAGTNSVSGIIEQSVSNVTVTGTDCGAVAGEIITEKKAVTDKVADKDETVIRYVDVQGSILNTYYNNQYSAIGVGELLSTNSVYSYTDITDVTQFENLDSGWTQGASGPVLETVNKKYDLSALTDKLGNHYINGSYVYLDNINTVVEDITGLYTLPCASVGVYDAYGNVKSDAELINSGDTLRLTQGDSQLSLNLVITGDIHQSRTFNALGLLTVKGAVLNIINITELSRMAADLDKSGTVDVHKSSKNGQ